MFYGYKVTLDMNFYTSYIVVGYNKYLNVGKV